MKNYKIIALVLAMGLIFTGCNMVEVNPERDAQTVIAKVGEEVVTKGDYQALYDMYVQYGQLSPDMADDPYYSMMYEASLMSLVDQLVDEKVHISKAKELGLYDLTAEEQEELQTQVDGLLNTYIMMYQSELSIDPLYEDKTEDELNQLAREKIDEFLSEFGMTKEEVVTGYTNQLVLDKLFESITGDISVTEEEVKTEYDGRLAAQRLGFEEGTQSYEQIANNGTEALYYTPEGVRQAQHILISISEEDSAKIQELQQAGDEEGAQTALDEALANIKDDADAAYNRAVGGEDFVALMEEIGEDPGMTSKEYYLVMEDTQQFVPEFAAGLFALSNVGDISEPIETAFGYHIIKYYGDEPSGEVNYDDVHDTIYDEMLADSKNAYFTDELAKWKEAMKIDVDYDKVIE